MRFQCNGKVYSIDQSVEIGEVVYPIRGLMPAERAALGIVEIIEDPRPDDRFYFVNENPAQPGKWQYSPKPLDQLKKTAIAQIKATAASFLTPQDWKVIRAASGGTPLTAADKASLQAIRDNSNTLELEINAITTIDQLVAWQAHGWPA